MSLERGRPSCSTEGSSDTQTEGLQRGRMPMFSTYKQSLLPAPTDAPPLHVHALASLLLFCSCQSSSVVDCTRGFIFFFSFNGLCYVRSPNMACSSLLLQALNEPSRLTRKLLLRHAAQKQSSLLPSSRPDLPSPLYTVFWQRRLWLMAPSSHQNAAIASQEMLELISANLRADAEFVREFEFLPVANAASTASASCYRMEDGCWAPADELFYRGQLLPLLLPCRLKMVQDMSNSEASSGNVDPKEEDGDLCEDCKALHAPYPFLSQCSSEGLSSPILNNSCGEFVCSSDRGHPNASIVTISKMRLKWKYLLRKGKRWPLAEGACCHYTSGIRNDTCREEYVYGVKPAVSSSDKSGVCSAAPNKPSRTLSSLSSSALLVRNPSGKSRSFCEKGSQSAVRIIKSKAKAQKDSIVLKTKNCLERSLRILRLARQHRGIQHKLQYDHQWPHAGNVPKKRSQVAHCGQSNSECCIGIQDESPYVVSQDIDTQVKNRRSPEEEMGYWDLHVADYNEREHDRKQRIIDDYQEEDEPSQTAFITMEPTFQQETKDHFEFLPALECSRVTSSGSFQSHESNLCSSDTFEVHDSIQGAIAHCKASV